MTIKNLVKKSKVFSSDKASRSSLIYLSSVTAVFIIICLITGNPKWIFSVFTNTVSGVFNDDTPRFVTSYISFALANIATGLSRDAVNELIEPFAMALPVMILMSVQFTTINNIIMRFVKTETLLSKFFALISGYILQSVIVVSWAPPVDITTFISNFYIFINFFIPISIISIVVPIFYNAFKNGNFEIDDQNNLFNFPLCVFIYFTREFIKTFLLMPLLLFIIGVFSIIFSFINPDLLIPVLSVVSPLIYMLLNQFADKTLAKPGGLIDKISIKFTDFDSDYKDTVYTDAFAAVCSVGMMISCIIIYFKLT